VSEVMLIKRLQMIMVLIALTSNVACSRKIDRGTVIGKYAANHEKGLDAIELLKDGTYVYDCRLKSGKELHNTDRWTFAFEDGEPRITFNHFVFCLPEYGAKPGYWDVKAERSLSGAVHLVIDPDLNYYYAKQSQN
jgi:hypothetical protein